MPVLDGNSRRHASEVLAISLDSLRRNRLRVFLAVLGVMIGSACIILVVTVSLTERRYVMEQIEAVGSNLIYADYEPDYRHPPLRNENITLDDVQAVKADVPEAAESAGTDWMLSDAQLDGKDVPANLVGVTQGFQEIRKLVIPEGRYFGPSDLQSRSKVCLITSKLAERLSPGEDVVGKSIRVGDVRLDVIGVFEERVSSFGLAEIQRESVLVPFQEMKYIAGNNKVEILYVQARTPGDVGTVTKAVSRVLHSRHPGPYVYRVQNLEAVLNMADHVGFALRLVMMTVALIAMVSSGIGIMNVMLMSVTERTQEIGIRRAFGARRVHILHQFLIEAMIISLAGALAGIVVGLAIPALLEPMLQQGIRVESSWASPLLALLVSCLFGLFFGYLPANRAAKVDPCESLRYE
ncbi:MAG TPA: ABC transporter permease [Candidatus Acidoferrales bacterium]|nr:ABC transporter permease [Candidatus Acidoferrales bacterium]